MVKNLSATRDTTRRLTLCLDPEFKVNHFAAVSSRDAKFSPALYPYHRLHRAFPQEVLGQYLSMEDCLPDSTLADNSGEGRLAETWVGGCQRPTSMGRGVHGSLARVLIGCYGTWRPFPDRVRSPTLVGGSGRTLGRHAYQIRGRY